MPDIFPFGPNIRRSAYVVTREYRTDIITSRSGREQRRALRQTPRKRIEYLAGVKGDCMRDFDRIMVTAQRNQLAIHERVRFVVLPIGLPGGNSSVIIDPVPSWIVADAVLMLANGNDYAFRTVQSVAGTTVTFTGFEATSWPAGTKLHPALYGYLEATIPTSLVSQRQGVVNVSVTFNVDPGTETVEDDGSAPATLGTREVFLTRPSSWLPIDIGRVQEGAAPVDYGFGRVRRFFPVEFSTRMWEAGYTGCDFDRADAIRQLFDRMKGRRGEFYMPTWQADLVPSAGVSSGGTTLLVDGEGLAAAYDDSTVYAALALRKTDGTWITRTVTNVADITGGGASITVGTAWGQNVGIGEIERVSWLPVWRFASDILTMSWPREDLAEIRLPLQMIENLSGT